MCVKIVAECKEDGLFETVAIQDTLHRVLLFIQYLYPDETRPEMRKRQKKGADPREAKVGEPVLGAVEDFFDLDFAATIKTSSFPWPVYSSLSLVESLTFSWYCIRHEFGISWKPSDYSGLFQAQAIDPPSPSHEITQ